MKTNIVKIVVTLLLLCGLMLPDFYAVPQETSFWNAPPFTDTIKNPAPLDSKSMEAAKKIYDSQCWVCHGLSGKGDGPASANCPIKPADHTSAQVQKQSDGALFWKITTGKGTMQPYAKILSPKQRWLLVHYIRTMAKNKGLRK